MCGIFGAAGTNFDSTLYQPAEYLKVLAHRGPDGNGCWRDGNVALGHVRLAIIDLSPRGAQPMANSDGSIIVSYNGELYNYVEIRDELMRLGRTFVSDSDTEVILQAYGAWGVAAFARFNGMFAVAIFDRAERKLVLCRDSAGIKPLYFAVGSDSTLYFGSEVKALPESLVSSIDEDRISEYLYFGAVHGGRTIRSGVSTLSPGGYLEYSLETGRITLSTFWPRAKAASAETVPARARQSSAGGVELSTRLREILVASVGRQLVSDRPVGIFLSGGVDSSAIACIAANYHDRQLDTFTARFSHSKSEMDLAYAKRLSDSLGCRNHVIDVDVRVSPEIVDRVLRHFDGPFPDAAAIPLMILCESLPSELKVVLQGDGGDELFGGYPRYRYLRYREAMRSAPLGLGAAALSGVRALAPLFSRRWQRLIHAFAEPSAAMAIARFLTVEFPEDKYSPERVFCMPDGASSPFATHERFYSESSRVGDVGKSMDVDFRTILPDYFLEKVDRSTMAASIEVRVPLLDQELIDFASGLSAEQILPEGRSKALLRAALDGVVPPYILAAKKRGFGTPYGEWIRTVLADVVEEELRQTDLFDRPLVLKMFEQHVRRREDHSFMLWKLFLFARWTRTRVSRPLVHA